MPQVEVPQSWKDVRKLGHRIGAAPAFMEQIEIMSNANKHSVQRLIMGNQPPLLPGVVQTPEYIRGILKEFGKGDSDEVTDTKVAMRLGMWALFLDRGAKLEVGISKGALSWRPDNVGGVAMHDTLNRTLEIAGHPQVDLRVFKDGPFDERPRQVSAVYYQNGPEAGRGEGTVDGVSLPSVMPVKPTGVNSIERMWERAQAEALSTDESRLLIEAAIGDLNRGDAPA